MNPLRTLAAASILESFLFAGSVATLIPIPKARLTARLRLNRWLARAMAKVIGLHITGSLPERSEVGKKTGRLILANHTSVLDAIALATLGEVIFVTSRDIIASLLVRWLATVGGAAFIERRNRDGRDQELATLEFLLRAGRTIVIFPEGTSTDGSEILRFRNGLLSAALRISGVEIIPTCLQYRAIGGEPISVENRHRIFLYGDISIGAHLARIFSNPPVRVDVQAFTPFEAAELPNPAKLAAHAEFLVRSVYSPVL